MNKEKYLTMNLDELFSFFITDVLDNPRSGEILVDELTKTERYLNDYEFRTSVETAKGILIGMKGVPTDLLPIATNLVKTSRALKLHQLEATNWNLLGVAYSQSELYEKAIECYHKAVMTEKRYNLVAISSIAYNNIAMVYINFNLFDKSCEYFNLALETLKKGGENQPRYHSKLVLYKCNLITAYCRMGNPEPVPALIEKINSIGVENTYYSTKVAYHFALMYYYYTIQDYEKGREYYYLSKKYINPKNTAVLYALVGDFVDLNIKANFDSSYYRDELLEAEALQNSNMAIANVLVYKKLRQYYKQNPEGKKYCDLLEKYVSFLEEDSELMTKRQSASLLLVDNIIQENEGIDFIKLKNTELELIAKEALKNKDALQKAYQQINLINKLGKKITSSLKVDDVANLVYQIIRERLPVSEFFILVKDEACNTLKTIVYYNRGVKQPDFYVNLSKSHGFVAECFKQNRIISTHDKDYSLFYQEQKVLQDNNEISSAIFLPLNVDGKIIGICSIQDTGENAYNEENQDFLEKLIPYLSISLHNAIYRMELEREIQSHLSTQTELREANNILQKISSLDGLTQISSRRDFDNRIVEMISNAKRAGLSVSIFMLDIDNFKLFNDTYGHLEGDEALKKVAKVFRTTLDSYNGLSARFGGEEFIGACIGLSQHEAYELAETIRKNVCTLNIPHKFFSYKRISISVGVAFSDKITEEHKSEIMRQADQCLYTAKESGKNRVVLKVFTPSI